MGSNRAPFQYCEGESLHPEEMVLYALLKLTASPLYDKKYPEAERETLIKYNASVVCDCLNRVFGKAYHKEDLYFYLCLMKSLTTTKNPSKIGFFCGQPRDEVFAPYVRLFLSKAASTLSNLIGQESQPMSEKAVKTEATSICQSIVTGQTNMTLDSNPSLVFAGLHLSVANYPGWRYEQREGELLLWKPLVSRPYMTEKVVRIYEDLHWEIEVPGKKANPQPVLATSRSVVNNILRNVDRAYVCQGMAKSYVPAEILAHRFQAGTTTASVFHDSDGCIIARDNGDFLLSEECHGLVMSDEKRDGSDRDSHFPKVCIACVALVDKLATESKKSFEAETLSLIAKLNSELSERKQQVTSLWERYSSLRDSNQKLTAQLKDKEDEGISIASVDGAWLELHHQQVQELGAKLLEEEMERNNRTQGIKRPVEKIVSAARSKEGSVQEIRTRVVRKDSTEEEEEGEEGENATKVVILSA